MQTARTALAARLARYGDGALLGATVSMLAAGGLVRLFGEVAAARALWATTAAVGLAAATWWVAKSLWARHLGVDVIAVLALAGALAVGEELAGAVIAVMLATGRTLESAAAGRARHELRSLLDRAPRTARRHTGDGSLTVVSVDAVRPGDLLLVAPGEVVPVDGTVSDTTAVLDESALTGEPVPVLHAAGDPVRSGAVNAAGPFDLRATTDAAGSTYAGIVALVRDAAADSAPFVRLADRYALWFVAVSLAVAAVAWALSGEMARAVAVLVVATPCPLLLAAPIAVVSGMSRAARRGVVVKGGAALEGLGRCKTLMFDKTGTLTAGRPTVAAVVAAEGHDADEVLAAAASLDQVSPHVLAAAVVAAATERGLRLELPAATEEVAGRGVKGKVGSHSVAVGSGAWVGGAERLRWARAVRLRAEIDGATVVFVGIDDVPAGAVVIADPIRPDAARTVRQLRRSGIERIVMVTGDRLPVAEAVGAVIGVDEVLAERTPGEKVEAVRVERRRAPTVMVGDGINDAPALALADVGVAVGARGATASSEAADVVLTVDRIDRVGEATAVARRSLGIATQSAAGGIAMSLVAMAAAAVGLLPAVWGAMLQEVIDVAVIANALRALKFRPDPAPLDEAEAVLARRFQGEHRVIAAAVDALRAAADTLGESPSAQAWEQVRRAHRMLVDEVLPHEEAEDEILYPALAQALGGTDPLAAMSRAHVEIAHQIRRLGRLIDSLDVGDIDAADVAELRRLLYGLHAILRLHTAQEEESYLSLADVEPVASTRR